MSFPHQHPDPAVRQEAEQRAAESAEHLRTTLHEGQAPPPPSTWGLFPRPTYPPRQEDTP